MKTMIKVALAGLILFAACPGYESKSDKLNKALREFHTLLKFKEYLRASEYITPFYQKEFMDKFASGTVMIEEFEVRGLKTDSKDMDKMEVTIRLLLRPSNSMTIKYTTMIERWVYIRTYWRLANIRESVKVKSKTRRF